MLSSGGRCRAGLQAVGDGQQTPGPNQAVTVATQLPTVMVGVHVRKLHVGSPVRHGHAVAVKVALQLLRAHHAVVVGVNLGEQLQGRGGSTGSSGVARGAACVMGRPENIFEEGSPTPFMTGAALHARLPLGSCHARAAPAAAATQ